MDKTESSKDYECGDVFNIYYPRNNLPSDEKLKKITISY